MPTHSTTDLQWQVNGSVVVLSLLWRFPHVVKNPTVAGFHMANSSRPGRADVSIKLAYNVNSKVPAKPIRIVHPHPSRSLQVLESPLEEQKEDASKSVLVNGDEIRSVNCHHNMFVESLVLLVHPMSVSKYERKTMNTSRAAEVRRIALDDRNENRRRTSGGSRTPTTPPLQWYNKAVGMVDKMLCCSYSGNQVHGEVPEVDYVEDQSISSMFEEQHISQSAKTLRFSNPHGVDRIRREYGMHAGDREAYRRKHYSNANSSRKTSFGTAASDVTDVTASTTQSWNTLPTLQSSMSLTDNTIDNMSRSDIVPGSSSSYYRRQQRLYEESKYHTDPQLAEQELIRRVQAESLAQLPYLSQTEGYHC